MSEGNDRKRAWLEWGRQAVAQRPHPPCSNCLRPAAIAVDIGPELGSQRDPYREQLWLCPDCVEALLDDLDLFRTRFSRERTVRRTEWPALPDV